MHYLTLTDALETYNRTMVQSGGMAGILSLGALESALAQPRMTFEGADLYPTIVGKVAALGFSAIKNHPFVDGNKRTGHAMMEMFLSLNGYTIDASIEEQVIVVVGVASGEMGRSQFAEWIRAHIRPKQ